MGAQHVDEVAEREEFRKKHLHKGLSFKNLKIHPVHQRRLRGSASAHFELADNQTNDAHISELAPGDHNKMHRHMNEAIIYVLSGRGYSLIQRDGEPAFRVDWEEGDMLSPPLFAWHQHFNTDQERPARYLAITNVPLMIRLGLFRKEQRREETEG